MIPLLLDPKSPQLTEVVVKEPPGSGIQVYWVEVSDTRIDATRPRTVNLFTYFLYILLS